jgi:glutaredoxin
MSKGFIKNLIPVSIVVAGLLIAGALIYLNQGKIEKPEGQILTPQQAAEKAIDYINQNLLQQGTSASLSGVAEENGVYKFRLKIGENEYDSYVTKDGELLFTEGINLNPPSKKDIPKTELPDVDLFVMAFCPYGNQAEEIMEPVVKLLGNKAKIELHYVIYSDYASGFPDYCLDEENKYCSMHGIQELNQGVRELCVQKYQKDKLWDFVMKINKETTSENVDEKWEEIAKNFGIDIQKIKDCQTTESETLLAEEVELNKIEYPVQDPGLYNDQEKITISGSPTLVINGMVYGGERSSEDYKNGICSGFKSPPEECSEELDTESGSPGGC